MNTATLKKNRWKYSLKAFSIHFFFSLLVALSAAVLIFKIWFPYPHYHLSGGIRLFLLIIIVDMVCGPLITAIIFNPDKSRLELSIDLFFVAVLQCTALAYGLYSMALARPVVQAFEVDRFVVVSATEVAPEDLPNAPKELQQLSWSGPYLIGTKISKNGQETFKSLELSLQGIEPSARPSWWQPYTESIPDVKKRMKKLDLLYATRSEKEKIEIDKVVRRIGKKPDQLYYLPLTNSKKVDEWIALLNTDAQIVGYIPIGGF